VLSEEQMDEMARNSPIGCGLVNTNRGWLLMMLASIIVALLGCLAMWLGVAVAFMFLFGEVRDARAAIIREIRMKEKVN
jgi:hypothetical protein